MAISVKIVRRHRHCRITGSFNVSLTHSRSSECNNSNDEGTTTSNPYKHDLKETYNPSHLFFDLKYILDTSVFPREHPCLKELREMTEKHPR
ncbi:S-adenosyl-L-methionine-dependent methyltransferase superfamily protein, putative [Medicago truncatula]|uniref:S-adenosyl-L-methionine-dependent methyltransferase superfamily protein, putative n=1 Tax=Medicago truncatula TaxID=3880 RepID=A0A072TXK3_MEDTR|nr:S-adenosyl-L-methionine-dependent methyltransferase superfamily protein, putative [Medicago truncatula]